MRITKQLISKFENSEIQLKTYNGYIQVATITAKYANGRNWEIRVTRTHPLLEKYGTFNTVSLYEPLTTSSGINHISNIPSVFDEFIQKAYDAAEISNTRAKVIDDYIINRIERYNNNMNI